ncbi:MAG TPA: peptidase E [Candidatus Binataceae bacterium]|jgi:dipeptidase E|nr:peptidase E [Candidatus Binataceae bacterium]
MKAHKLTHARHIVALGGGGLSMEPDNPLLDDFILSLTGERRPKVCFVPTASGDSDNYVARFYRAFHASRCSPSHLPFFHGQLPDLTDFLSSQDVIYVGGGSTANMLAVWRVHAMDKAIAVAWRKGVVLCGVSAGGMCWFQAGITDSFGSRLAPLRDGLGFLKGAFCPHYDSEQGRRPTLQCELRMGFPSTIAADDGVGLHFVGIRVAEAVSSRPAVRAYWVRFVDRKIIEAPIPTRYLGKP